MLSRLALIHLLFSQLFFFAIASEKTTETHADQTQRNREKYDSKYDKRVLDHTYKIVDAVKEFTKEYLGGRSPSVGELSYWRMHARGIAHIRHAIKYSEEAKKILFEKILSQCTKGKQILNDPDKSNPFYKRFKNFGMCREEIEEMYCDELVSKLDKAPLISPEESTCEEAAELTSLGCHEDFPYGEYGRICYHFAYDFHLNCIKKGKTCVSIGIKCSVEGHLMNAIQIAGRGWCVIEPQYGDLSKTCVSDPKKIHLNMAFEAFPSLIKKENICSEVDRVSEKPIKPGT